MKAEEKQRLKEQARQIWYHETRRGTVRPNSKQRDTLNAAYWAGVLPTDDPSGGKHSIYQWVEDNYPTIIR